MKILQFNAVQSSNVEWVGYCGGRLYVRFRENQKVYRWVNVALREYEDVRDAKSVGKTLNELRRRHENDPANDNSPVSDDELAVFRVVGPSVNGMSEARLSVWNGFQTANQAADFVPW